MSRCNIKVKYAACGEEHTVLLADVSIIYSTFCHMVIT